MSTPPAPPALSPQGLQTRGLQHYPVTVELNMPGGFLLEGQLPHRLELDLERLDDPLRVGHQSRVAGHPEHDPARVADDADPQSEPPRLRHPEHDLVDLAAGQ